MAENQDFFNSNEFNKKRLLSIDIFKGATIILMIFVNIISKYQAVPAWSKHGVGYAMTYVDLVLPLFLFIMTLNFKNSYLNRLERSGKREVYIHFIRRYLIFIVVGFLFSINFSPPFFRWGALQVLGLSGLFLLPTIELTPRVRLFLASILILLHQIVIIPNYSLYMENLWAGGIYSTLAWGAMMLLASVIVEGVQNKKIKEYFIFGGFFCLVVSFSLFPFWGLSMSFTTIPYVFFSVGFCSLCYYLFYSIIDSWGQKKNLFLSDNFLSILGKNAFILYILHILLRLITNTLLPSDTSITIIFTAVFFNAMMIWGFAYILNKKQKFIKI